MSRAAWRQGAFERPRPLGEAPDLAGCFRLAAAVVQQAKSDAAHVCLIRAWAAKYGCHAPCPIRPTAEAFLADLPRTWIGPLLSLAAERSGLRG